MQFKFSDLSTHILEGMWAATGKAYYNPETGTNWCHLPMEMRMKCIEEMDFETRIGLKRTAKTENLLVKSTKCYLESFEMDVSPSFQTLRISNKFSRERVYRQFKNNSPHFLKCSVNILESCEIDTFDFSGGDDEFLTICAFLQKTAPFRFKTFKSNSLNTQMTQFFLKNCEGVENILLRLTRLGRIDIENWIDFPSVINAKLVQISYLEEMEQPVGSLVQKWIDNDAEIGKKLRFAIYTENAQGDVVEKFASIFEDRVISKDEKNVRIFTDNDSKHVLLTCDKIHWMAAYFTCTIIPSNLLKLPEDCKWAKELHKWEFIIDEEEDSDSDSD